MARPNTSETLMLNKVKWLFSSLAHTHFVVVFKGVLLFSFFRGVRRRPIGLNECTTAALISCPVERIIAYFYALVPGAH